MNINECKINDKIIIVAKSNNDKKCTLVNYYNGIITKITEATLFVHLDISDRDVMIKKQRIISVNIDT